MKSIITYYLTCIFLCAGFLSNAQKISSHERFRIADSLSKSGEIPAARIQLERVRYETRDTLIINQVLFKKAELLKKESKFIEAQRCLEKVDYGVLPDSLHFKFRFETALCAYLGGDFNGVISHSAQLKYYIKDTTITDQMLPLEILALNELHQWERASDLALYYILLNKEFIPDSLSALVKSAYEDKSYPKLKSVHKAQIMSFILPGLGQMYAGFPGEALLNFSFTMGSLAITCIAIYYTYYFTAYFAGLALFQKFYLGANKRVGYLVDKRNYMKTRLFNDNIRQLLINIEKLKE